MWQSVRIWLKMAMWRWSSLPYVRSNIFPPSRSMNLYYFLLVSRLHYFRRKPLLNSTWIWYGLRTCETFNVIYVRKVKTHGMTDPILALRFQYGKFAVSVTSLILFDSSKTMGIGLRFAHWMLLAKSPISLLNLSVKRDNWPRLVSSLL